MRYLLKALDAAPFPFDHDRKIRSALRLLMAARARRPRLIVMEGTGLAGGMTLLVIDALLGVPFVVSGGDAVAPYLRLRSRLIGPFAAAYERISGLNGDSIVSQMWPFIALANIGPGLCLLWVMTSRRAELSRFQRWTGLFIGTLNGIVVPLWVIIPDSLRVLAGLRQY